VSLCCLQAEDDDGPVGRTPGGMHVVILPYASEVREAPLDVGHASEEQILASEQIVNALQLEEFDCRDFPNPGEQSAKLVPPCSHGGTLAHGLILGS